ncbi:hypothetical protein [Aeromonas dhakensis]|uniref:hypothetical protein n=1 Tax=Aeromonas dhakensis TaxID=196024 RepID=UPI001181BAF8|nr:hypothetical protein [Aeromonas dhakensis]
MSIKQQVEDAVFLAENGRYLGAFTNLMLAVAASSRKTFPKGKTKSLEDPTKNMGDGEAFTLFVGGRIRKILFGDFGGPNIGSSGIGVNFKGKQYDVAYIIYKYYRCELVHEGELPEDIEFRAPSEGQNLSVNNGGVSVSIGCGNTMVLDYGWIGLLIEAVVFARCNGDIFDIGHHDLVPKDGINEEDHCNLMIQEYGITPGRYQILKEAVLHITPESVVNDDEELLIIKFSELVSKNIINGGAITGLSNHDLSDRNGKLLPKGLEIIKKIGAVYVRVAV